MIAEYKFYHGAVLAELVNLKVGPLEIDELNEDGRLSSYVLNAGVGLQIKHCANRLHPWQFTFTKSNIMQLLDLQNKYKEVFIALVCCTDGIVTLALHEAIKILESGDSEQAWIRVDRKKNELYSVSCGAAELPGKRARGVRMILQALGANL